MLSGDRCRQRVNEAMLFGETGATFIGDRCRQTVNGAVSFGDRRRQVVI